MLPQNYKTAWIIRFAIVSPITVISLISTYLPVFKKYLNQIVFTALLAGQTGIFLMILIADPDEPAFYAYYVGSILVLLTCQFIFQVSLKPAILFFILSISGYILIGVLDQQLLTETSFNYNPQWLIGNFFFFTAAGIISLLGLYRFHRSREEAEYANQVKTSFLANISHEIRTPLNGITGCARLITEPGVTEKNRLLYEEIIGFSSKQLLDIVDSILLMSEIETGKAELFPEQISLNSIISELSKQFAFMAEQKKLTFISECLISREQDIFITDVQKFRMILSNLLNNAVKFTSSGSVTLKSGFITAGLRIIVEDTGLGIDQPQLDKIFDSFFQTDKGYSREYGGNGLGLSICKSYISMLKGQITVQSKLGKGTIFTVTLPVLMSSK
jgi:signal transduction histidine kinase